MGEGDGSKLGRRDFVVGGVGAAAGVACASDPAKPSPSPEADAGPREVAAPKVDPSPPGPPLPTSIPMRVLGKTGVRVTTFGLGGQGMIQSGGRDTALAIIEKALELGVSYYDTSKVYGPSEVFLGEGLEGKRNRIFLATKTFDRRRDEALRQLDDSLVKLRTDHIDLWQLHHVRFQSDIDQIFGTGGVLEAMLRARDQKIVRYLGVTGHYDPDVLEQAIDRFDFDVVLMAVNAADAAEKPFRRSLLPKAVQKNMGVVAMKVPARGEMLKAIPMKDAYDYALNLPIATAIIGCDSAAHVEENVTIARNFAPLTSAQATDIEARALVYGQEATFFRRPPYEL